ncbi:MAG: hypothetical protein GC137_02805 [Alphaproteobacteria bacterium]|nr:hypothetical protein [Alphaproteobacteria bacterium]
MSTVNASDSTKVETSDDVFPMYDGVGENAKAGIEVELAYFDPEDPNLKPMTLAQNRILRNSAREKLKDLPPWLNLEATTDVLEVASIARGYENAKEVLDDTNLKIRTLTEKATEIGLKRSYFQELPDKTADDLLASITDVDRYQAFFNPYRADNIDLVRYFSVCKSNQVSVSYSDYDHLLKNVRRLYVLAPFLYLLTDNSSAFIEGKTFSGHIGMHFRHYGLRENKRGNVVPYIFTAKTGEEFIANHIEHVMTCPMFVYFGEEGQLIKIPTGDWSTNFRTLKERGLNTASNYYLAQSTIWPDVKIATLKDSEGNVTGHRYEARMLGVGIHQHQTSFIIVSGLAFHPTFGDEVDALLCKYGFDVETLEDLYPQVSRAYQAARQHNGEFFNIPYGKGKMAEFAKEFAKLIERVGADMDLIEETEPMIKIMETGCTDGKVNRLIAPTLEDVIAFQRNYDLDVFDNPNMSGSDVFAKMLGKGNSCKSAERRS